MSQLAISEVARMIGVRASAIRYYEQIGILPSAQRICGQRRYDMTVLHRLAVIQCARETGFSLGEIRELFFGFADGTRASTRWQKLSQQKLTELEAIINRTEAMQRLLVRLQSRCRCDTLDQCGNGLLKERSRNVRVKAIPTPVRRRGTSGGMRI
jgi:MerR family transcriptional regulator, redox-sensitive transcriptional activator SoxR